jgi:guanylate kinase
MTMTKNEVGKRLFVLSGPSGCGKDTVIKCLKMVRDDIFLSVSCTTRAPRENEREGVDYYYITSEQFRQMIEDGEILEYNFYAGNYYGTSRQELDRGLAEGKIMVLVIDVNGAHTVRRLYPDATLVFLLPPSIEVLRQRIAGRGLTNDVEERMKIAIAEIADADNFDYRLVNDDLETCVNELSAIIDTVMNKANQMEE